MSLATWKREFYRTLAHKVSKRYAVQHSLKKWIGLKPFNRKKHNVSLYDGKLMNNSDIKKIEKDDPNRAIDYLEIDDDTCALCRHFQSYNCHDKYNEECPLAEVGACCTNDDSPFDLFVSSGRISPMIKALEKAKKKRKI